MRDKVFTKKAIIKTVTENVRTMYRKTLEEATQQELFQAVAYAVKDVVMDVKCLHNDDNCFIIITSLGKRCK